LRDQIPKRSVPASVPASVAVVSVAAVASVAAAASVPVSYAVAACFKYGETQQGKKPRKKICLAGSLFPAQSPKPPVAPPKYAA
jgi:hypothetical protein